MKWIVGLGNPGRKYAKTRHNIGFMALDRLAEDLDMSWREGRGRAIVGEGHIQGQKVMLLKPQTYMNLSGESVSAYMSFYKLHIEDLIVVYDDLDTEFGKIRLRYKGSSGGHNGMKSIIQHVGTQQFKRIRLGISQAPPGYDIADYVLSKFTRSDAQTLDNVLKLTCEAIHDAIIHPFDKVMAKFN